MHWRPCYSLGITWGCRLSLRPLRNLVLVERLPDLGRTRDASGNEFTAGGIMVPGDYKARGSVKAVRKSDHFMARVIAVGPLVTDSLVVPGAEVPVLTWADEADGTRRGMYTGVDYTKDQLFVSWPEDFGGCVMNAPPAVGDGVAESVLKSTTFLAEKLMAHFVASDPLPESDSFPQGHPYRKAAGQ